MADPRQPYFQNYRRMAWKSSVSLLEVAIKRRSDSSREWTFLRPVRRTGLVVDQKAAREFGNNGRYEPWSGQPFLAAWPDRLPQAEVLRLVAVYLSAAMGAGTRACHNGLGLPETALRNSCQYHSWPSNCLTLGIAMPSGPE
jgi:hypothetical protein